LRLRRLTRATDVLGRTGADELAVLMPGTTLSGAQACCERLIAELEAGDLPQAGFVTVSAGVAAYEPDTTLDDLLVDAAAGWSAPAPWAARARRCAWTTAPRTPTPRTRPSSRRWPAP
jgi:GGDEF domain-containing protein